MPSPTTGELLSAIRAHCMECSGGCRKQVEQCEIKNCRLYPYRMPDAKPVKKKDSQISFLDMIETKVG